MAMDGSATAHGCGSTNRDEICSTFQETSLSWPFRIKLTTDHIRWDSLKISSSKEFEEHILGNINETGLKALNAWIPLEISLYDTDTDETYPVKLAKKESFWFEPTPFLFERPRKEKPFFSKATMMKQPCHELEEARKVFAYSIEPFRQIVKRRNLDYNQEIGLRWSSSTAVEKLEFAVLHVPRLDLHSLKI